MAARMVEWGVRGWCLYVGVGGIGYDGGDRCNRLTTARWKLCSSKRNFRGPCACIFKTINYVNGRFAKRGKVFNGWFGYIQLWSTCQLCLGIKVLFINSIYIFGLLSPQNFVMKSRFNCSGLDLWQPEIISYLPTVSFVYLNIMYIMYTYIYTIYISNGVKLEWRKVFICTRLNDCVIKSNKFIIPLMSSEIRSELKWTI